MTDLISRAAAIAEIEEFIEEYSELDPETGYHNLKWCAMEEAKDVLTMLPAVDAIPVDWLKHRLTMALKNGCDAPEQAIRYVLWLWEQQKDGEQEAQDG